jgi:hypothetical protein
VRAPERYAAFTFLYVAMGVACCLVDLAYRRLETRGLLVFRWDIADDSLTERYFELLKSAKVKGYLFQQQNYNDIPKSAA